jgi:type VI secretion system secreted protein Hcp
MATDTYMKIDGVLGESTDKDHKDWIELLGFDHEFTQPASATESSAGGGTVGRVNMGHYTVTKYLDKATPKLSEYCCSGKHLPSISIEMMRSSGDSRVKYMEVKMEDAVIGRVQHGRDDATPDKFPTEAVSFSFATVKWTYTQQQRSDGSTGGIVTGGWDLKAHSSAAG